LRPVPAEAGIRGVRGVTKNKDLILVGDIMKRRLSSAGDYRWRKCLPQGY
jgi:hypothetical protein